MWILDQDGNRIEITPQTKLTFKTVIYGICEKCGREFHRQYRNRTPKPLCASCSRQQTNIIKYGTSNPFASELIKEKIRRTNLKKYGVDNPSKSKLIQFKREQTFKRKYGVKTSLQDPDVRQKIISTNLNRYGATSYLGTKECRDKLKQSMLEKYGVEFPSHF